MMARKWFQLVGEDGNAVTSDVDFCGRGCGGCGYVARRCVCRSGACAPCAGHSGRSRRLRESRGVRREAGGVTPIGSFGGSLTHALIVQVPRRAETPLRTPAMDLLLLLLPPILAHAPTTRTDQDGSKPFKDRLCEYYGCFQRQKTRVRCMLLDVALPRALVGASHLFRRNHDYLALAMMQISDIDDEKNGCCCSSH